MGVVLSTSTAGCDTAGCALVSIGNRAVFTRHARRKGKCLTSSVRYVANVVFVYIRKGWGGGALVFSSERGAVFRWYAGRERERLFACFFFIGFI